MDTNENAGAAVEELKDKAKDVADTAKSVAETAKGEAQSVLAEAKSQGTEAVAKVKEQAAAVVGQAKDKANELVGQAKTQVTETLTTQKDSVAGAIGSVAEALRQVGEKQPENTQIPVAQYASAAADQVEKVGAYFRERDISEMYGDAETFARQQPALFLGGAFLAGIVLGRFLKSSGKSVSYSGSSFESEGQASYSSVSGMNYTAGSTEGYAPQGYVPGGILGTGAQPGENVPSDYDSDSATTSASLGAAVQGGTMSDQEMFGATDAMGRSTGSGSGLGVTDPDTMTTDFSETERLSAGSADTLMADDEEETGTMTGGSSATLLGSSSLSGAPGSTSGGTSIGPGTSTSSTSSASAGGGMSGGTTTSTSGASDI